MNNLKKYAGLLNDEAPENHFLAYITPGERDMLVNAGGVKTPTPSGIFAYPPGMGDPNYEGKTSDSRTNNPPGSDQGHSRFEVGSGYYGEPVTKTTPKNNNDDPIPSQPEVPIIYTEPGFGVDEGYDKTNLADPPENKVKTFFNDVKDYVLSGGMIGNATKFIEKLGKPIQTKMMTYSLNKRLEKIYKNNPDFEDYESVDEIPGEIGSKVVDLEKDLQGVRDGTFTQNDFTKKYGSGDVTNPNDKFYNPDALRENDITDLETYFAPELADIIGGTTPQESMVNQYFANTNNQNLGISSDYMTTYNKAKADLAKTLNMTANADQFGYSGTMTASNIYYNYLKEQGLL
jgi:hypothetical protein